MDVWEEELCTLRLGQKRGFLGRNGMHRSSSGRHSIPPSPFLRSGYCEDLLGTRSAHYSCYPVFEEKISRKDEYSQKYLRCRFQRKFLLVK
ncbi:hypothetical protein CDAR_468931 [Caerostris darwini]|uniref:Uncharacterized protein n=1 Tax=Caerostris darwini TaxID=1538125 RepID=A0AAV4R5R2_9ARAC|nr:hypothetical protein CDAR_468931 [Caerostris darwini]